MLKVSALVVAFLLDLKFGDPVYALHPVRLMGRAVAAGENFFRRVIANEKIGGALLAFGLPFAVFFIVSALGRIHPVLTWIVEVFGIYTALSIHDLRKEALRIYASLGQSDLNQARQNLSRIVGRDTETLDKPEVVRATVETVAESTLDGIVSPLFYAAIGGAPLALAYKMVNTLDSMIGHQNTRYQNFGFFAAKQDEIWNWIPARLSYYIAALAAFFTTGRMQEALFTGWQDGVSAPHGNGAIPEAAFAGALGVKLGGTNTYQGRIVEKPFLGYAKKSLERDDILKSIRLMLASAWITLAGAILIRWGIEKIV